MIVLKGAFLLAQSMQTQGQDHPASYMQLGTQYMSHQLEQVSCMLLGACVVRSAFVNFRVWPTHLLVLSGQEIQVILLWCLRILCLLHQVLSICCMRVFGQSCEHVSWPSCSMQTCSG